MRQYNTRNKGNEMKYKTQKYGSGLCLCRTKYKELNHTRLLKKMWKCYILYIFINTYIPQKSQLTWNTGAHRRSRNLSLAWRKWPLHVAHSGPLHHTFQKYITLLKY